MSKFSGKTPQYNVHVCESVERTSADFALIMHAAVSMPRHASANSADLMPFSE